MRVCIGMIECMHVCVCVCMCVCGCSSSSSKLIYSQKSNFQKIVRM